MVGDASNMSFDTLLDKGGYFTTDVDGNAPAATTLLMMCDNQHPVRARNLPGESNDENRTGKGIATVFRAARRIRNGPMTPPSTFTKTDSSQKIFPRACGVYESFLTGLMTVRYNRAMCAQQSIGTAEAKSSPGRAMNQITRRNMVNRQGESWRPPLFSSSTSLSSRLVSALRRMFDLQTSSIWRDLSAELPYTRGTVVDVGCGGQPYRRLFRSDVKYIGIDTVDAKAHFGYSEPETRYFEGTTWPIENESVDFVLCTETLEHVLDPLQFLKEARRCLVPGGRILLTVPFSARWHYIPYDYWRFTPSSLDHLLEAAGFTDVIVYARGNEVTVACYKTIALILVLLMPQGRSPLAGAVLRILSIPFLPLFVVLGVIGNLSLMGQGGDDCLGYTALGTKVLGT